jgi:acyl carrier protein
MTREELRALIVEAIGEIAPEADAAAVDDAKDLREVLDLDSMDIFNLVVAISDRLGIDIPDADAVNLVTLAGGIAYLETRLSRSKPDDRPA